MEYAIETEQLTKQYNSVFAANRVSLHVQKGEIYGFIGRNGAGKTTCMKIICGLTKPNDGTVKINGQINSGCSVIGNLIEAPGLYGSMTAEENLQCLALLHGKKADKLIPELLELVGLSRFTKLYVSQFSLGMRQRLGIAAALVGKPEFLVLDEPINGLDPQGIADVRNLILHLKHERKCTIMISSHILSELAKIADTFGIIHNGCLLREISAEELQKQTADHTEIVSENPQQVCDALKAYGIQDIALTEDGTVRFFGCTDRAAEINRILFENGCSIIESRRNHTDLEQYYLNLTGGAKRCV